MKASRYKNYFYFKGAYGVPVRVVFKDRDGYTLAVYDLTADDIARGYVKIADYAGETPAQVCVPYKTTFGFVVAKFDYAVETKPEELPEPPEAPAIPVEYQQVEYVATDGNQHIDTGILASDHPDGIAYAFEGNITDFLGQTSANYLFGALGSGVRAGNMFINPSLSYDQMGVYCGAASTTIARQDTPERGKDFAVTLFSTSTSNTVSATIDGKAFSKTADVSTADMPSANVYLFWCSGLSAKSTSKKYYGKLYSFTMDAADGTALRNFVPCYRVSDGVIGLYDTVEGVFYENAGTGSFTKGADVA